MSMDTFLRKAQAWVNPPRPGLNKNPVLGFLCGFFGPIGVGLYLRSLVDFGLSAVAVSIVMAFSGDGPFTDLLACLVGSVYVLGRIFWDTKRDREDRGDGGATASSSTPSTPGSPDRPSFSAALNMPAHDDGLRLQAGDESTSWPRPSPALAGLA